MKTTSYQITLPLLRTAPITRRVLHDLRDHLNGHMHADFTGYAIFDWPGPGLKPYGQVEPLSQPGHAWLVNATSQLQPMPRRGKQAPRPLAEFGGTLIFHDARELLYILPPFMDATDTATLPSALLQPMMVVQG